MRLAIALVAIGIAAPALAQPQCGPKDKVLEFLKDKFHEVPAFSGTTGDGNIPMFMTVSPEGSWTQLVAPKPDVYCMVASGDGWAAAAPSTEPEITKPALKPDGTLSPADRIRWGEGNYLRTI